MATVIDSLLVELGLDASKFDAAQKKSVEGLRKFDEANQKSAKSSQLGAAGMADGFTKAKNALLGFTAVALGVGGFKEFIDKQVFGNAQLGRTSILLGMSAQSLKAWGGVMEGAGGSAAAFQSTMQNIQGGIAQLVTTGSSANVVPLSRLGLLSEAMKTGTVDLFHLSDALVKFQKTHNTQQAFSLASQLGIDQATFQRLLEGPEALHKLYDAQAKLVVITDEQIKNDQRLSDKWALMKQTSSSLGTAILDNVGWINDLTDAMIKNASATTEWLNNKKPGNSWSDNVAWAVAGSHVEGVTLSADSKKRLAGGALRSQSGAVTGGSGVNLDVIRQIESNGNDRAVSPVGAKGPYQFMDPTAAQYGLQGDDVYDPEKSRVAASRYFSDLQKHYHGDTDKTVEAYNWGQGNLDHFLAGDKGYTNSAGRYVDTSRIPQETQGYLAKYHAAAGGGNSSQVETNIGTINVNTQATDANGVAKGIHQSLQQNTLISAATTGNN